jgi:hypothetical protein
VLSENPARSWKLAGIVLAVVACAAVAYLVSRSAGNADVPVAGTALERADSVEQIAAKRSPGEAEALAVAAIKDPSPAVRRSAMAGMTRHATAEHRKVFEQGVRDPDPTVRAIAADNLGGYRDAPATGVLVDLVRDDPDERARLAALRGLAECDDPRAIVTLLQTGESGKTKAMKLVAMKSLVRKFKGKLNEDRTPDNDPKWRDLIQRFKGDLRVRNAFAAAGVPINDRPGDMLGKDQHGERAAQPVAVPKKLPE